MKEMIWNFERRFRMQTFLNLSNISGQSGYLRRYLFLRQVGKHQVEFLEL